MNELATDFWSRVKSSLKERNFTQEELAKSAGVDFNNLKQQIFHKRMPSADDAVFIAQTLHTSVEYLVTGTEKNDAAIELAELKKKILEFANSI
jgi:transcriptional regulator with XRE-family HTH domain